MKLGTFVQKIGDDKLAFDGKIIKLLDKKSRAKVAWEYFGKMSITEELICDLIPSTLYGRN